MDPFLIILQYISGEIESTEATYKYHMQVQASPPAQTQRTMQQGHLKENLKPRKHRTPSGSSEYSTHSGTSQDKANTSIPSSPPQPESPQPDAEPQQTEVAQEAAEDTPKQ